MPGVPNNTATSCTVKLMSSTGKLRFEEGENARIVAEYIADKLGLRAYESTGGYAVPVWVIDVRPGQQELASQVS